MLLFSFLYYALVNSSFEKACMFVFCNFKMRNSAPAGFFSASTLTKRWTCTRQREGLEWRHQQQQQGHNSTHFCGRDAQEEEDKEKDGTTMLRTLSSLITVGVQLEAQGNIR